jgi:hypothetical protein
MQTPIAGADTRQERPGFLHPDFLQTLRIESAALRQIYRATYRQTRRRNSKHYQGECDAFMRARMGEIQAAYCTLRTIGRFAGWEWYNRNRGVKDADERTADTAAATIMDSAIAVLRRRFPEVPRAELELLLADVRAHAKDLLDLLITGTVALDTAAAVVTERFLGGE